MVYWQSVLRSIDMTNSSDSFLRRPALITLVQIVLILAFSACFITCSTSRESSLVDSVPPVSIADYHASETPCDPDALPAVKTELALLASLSNGERDGVICGQNLGHGDQILDPPGGLLGYESLAAELELQTGEVPGLLGLDFEHDQIYTEAQLHAAVQPLIEHAQAGGMVTVNWSPHSPWLNDETDIENNPGVWSDTRTTGGQADNVDLRQLVDPATPLYTIWHRKLDRVAAALAEMQQAGVVVLWRPMQEMDGDWFWWGIGSHRDTPDPYINLWRDMYTYLTETKGLHNLLWVFSPSMQETNPLNWLYPGDAYVDIVAGTTYHDQLIVRAFADLQQFNKVVGMAEFGTQIWRGANGSGRLSVEGDLDTTLYAHRLLNTYPGAAYWVSWHNWSNDDGTFEYQALVSNRNAAKLLQDNRILTLSRMRE